MTQLELTSKEKLQKYGFCVYKNALPSLFIQKLLKHSQKLIKQQTEAEINKFRSLGSLISLWRDPFYASLITHPSIINKLASIGGEDIRYSNGYLLAKPPCSVPTFWHQDWWLWSEPKSYTEFIPQVGVLCYLQDVNHYNGALRIIPGSHRQPHPIHSALSNIDNDELRRADFPMTAPYQSQPDELGFELHQGDIMMIDARLLHGAYANQSNAYRYGLTLWYYPNYHLFSEAIKSRIGTHCLDKAWSSHIDQMQPFLTHYTGDAQPQALLYQPQWRSSP